MPDIPQDHDGEVEELAAVANELKESIDTLSENFGVLSGKTDSNRRIAIVLSVVSAVVLVTVIVLSTVVIGLRHTNQRLEKSLRDNYTTSQQEAVTRVQVLCPLYLLFIGAVEHPQPGQVPPPASTVKTIKDGYAALKCP